jgi:hypothetical protein
MSGLLPHMSFVCLAPFIGAANASAFIEAKLDSEVGAPETGATGTRSSATVAWRPAGAAKPQPAVYARTSSLGDSVLPVLAIEASHECAAGSSPV